MKKLTALILAIILVFSTTVCFAHKIENTILGTTFKISDNWKKVEGSFNYSFEHKKNGGEYFFIDITEIDEEKVKKVEDIEEQLNEIYKDYYSDENLASSLSEANGNINISVTTDSVEIKYETYNNVTYYRYEKAYTAVAKGFENGRFYRTSFVTIQNDIMYEITYEHNYKTGHFSDIADMLNSAHYGKIIDIYVNEKEVVPDTYPEIYNDRTLVPIRAIVEELGYKVEWDAEKKVVSIKNEEIMLEFQINSFSMKRKFLDTQKEDIIKLDVPAVIANDRTYLPLRAVGEALNCDVNWDGATRTVTIKSR